MFRFERFLPYLFHTSGAGMEPCRPCAAMGSIPSIPAIPFSSPACTRVYTYTRVPARARSRNHQYGRYGRYGRARRSKACRVPYLVEKVWKVWNFEYFSRERKLAWSK
jgi:hypothetical protein